MIPAIQTHAFGCWFRSRLEARWATCFNSLGIAWKYEPEGFHLSSGGYLPDFLLTVTGHSTFELYAEVKGDLAGCDWGRLWEFADSHPLLILGDIPTPMPGCSPALFPLLSEGGMSWLAFASDAVYGISPEVGSQPVLVGGRLAPETPAVSAAFEAARSARFDGRKPYAAAG